MHYTESYAYNNTKIYGILSPVQTWDIEIYDVLDAIPIDIIQNYLNGKLEIQKENKDESFRTEH